MALRPVDVPRARPGTAGARRSLPRLAVRLLCALLAGATATACSETVRGGAFPNPDALESSLRRGVSTTAEVEQVLGKPGGFGGAILPTQPGFSDVWFYQDIEATSGEADAEGRAQMKVRQQVLLVFFKEGLFDGFMWYANSSTVRFVGN